MTDTSRVAVGAPQDYNRCKYTKSFIALSRFSLLILHF